MTYLESLRKSLHGLLCKNENVILLGEDILDPYGGAFKVTSGLSEEFGDRVIGTPISEAAITGIAIGLSIRGFLPVVEIMFCDFITLCADQLINHAAKLKTMYADMVDVPIVIRTPSGGGRGYGPTHSQSLEKLFFGVPHINVIAPSHFHEPGKLLENAVLNDKGVTVFVENKNLYAENIIKYDDILNIEFIDEKNGYNTAVIKNYIGGIPDVVIITYGGSAKKCENVMRMMASEEIKIQAIVPSSLKPLPVNTIMKGLEDGCGIIIAEEGTGPFNWGSEVSSIIYEKKFNALHAPIKRLFSKNTIIPVAEKLENEVLINENQIEKAILEVIEWQL
jgi:acetoin:2,6-dichlorophenolindophenol oxidoreductase subunit beta